MLTFLFVVILPLALIFGQVLQLCMRVCVCVSMSVCVWKVGVE